jgi:hypothetical protein
MFAALCIRVNVDGESLQDRLMFDYFLCAVQFVAVAVGIVNVVYAIYHGYQEDKETLQDLRGKSKSKVVPIAGNSANPDAAADEDEEEGEEVSDDAATYNVLGGDREKPAEVEKPPDTLRSLVALLDKDGYDEFEEEELRAAGAVIASALMQKPGVEVEPNVEPPLPDYLQAVNQDELVAVKRFLASPQLQDLVQLFDTDGDGEIDEEEIRGAKQLVKSMQASKADVDIAEGLDKLDAVKRDEKVARLKVEEKTEAAMRREHDKISARLAARREKRQAALGKLEQADREEELKKKVSVAGGAGGAGLEAILDSPRDMPSNVDMSDLMDDT